MNSRIEWEAVYKTQTQDKFLIIKNISDLKYKIRAKQVALAKEIAWMTNISGACVTHAEIARAGFFPYQWRNQNVLRHVPLSHYSEINNEFPNRMRSALKNTNTG